MEMNVKASMLIVDAVADKLVLMEELMLAVEEKFMAIAVRFPPAAPV